MQEKKKKIVNDIIELMMRIKHVEQTAKLLKPEEIEHKMGNFQTTLGMIGYEVSKLTVVE